MKNEKRMADRFEIIHAIRLGDKEVVCGEYLKNESGPVYMVGFCTIGGEVYSDTKCSEDYLEVMREFVARVEKQIEMVQDEWKNAAVPMDVFTQYKNEKRMAGTYAIIHAIHLGDNEVVCGQDLKSKDGLVYMVGYCATNDIFRQYSEIRGSDDYLEVMREFAARVGKQIESVRAEREKVAVPLKVFTPEHCCPNDYAESIEGKVVAIRLSSLRPEYRRADHQIMLVTGGFGSYGNARGRAVYNTNLYSGKESRWNREDVLGVVKEEFLPDWAKQKLEEIKNPEKPPMEKAPSEGMDMGGI